MTYDNKRQSQQIDDSVCLNIKNLKVYAGDTEIIHGIDLTIHKGERFGLIGESGSGKSLTCLSIMGLLDSGLRAEGSIELLSEGVDILDLSEKERCALRGNAISMVFQEPMTALNPLMTVGKQISETLTIHGNPLKGKALHAAVTSMLSSVGIAEGSRVFTSYPFQLSGGQRQRVMLAMAMINRPDILLADEPTTALDVTVQQQVIQLMDEQVASAHSSLLFITHDLGVVAGLCDTVAIMRHGYIVEHGPLNEVFAHPQHPYTQALLAAAQLTKDPKTNRLLTLDDIQPEPAGEKEDSNRIMQGISESSTHPKPATLQSNAEQNAVEETRSMEAAHIRRILRKFSPPHECMKNEGQSIIFNRYQPSVHENPPEVVLQVTDLTRQYKSGMALSNKTVNALNGVSFDVHRGEKFGIVGESGCGKSTTLRILAGLDQATSGSVQIQGHEIEGMTTKANAWVHRIVQIVFQDPMSSLDPRMRVWESISEPIVNESRDVRRKRAATMLEAVGMERSALDRFPHQFSGGQRQRIAIARALVTHPDILIADEAVSALDVSVRAQVLNLLSDLADAYAFTLIFVSHDLHVVRNQCDVIAVMHQGHIVECGKSDDIYDHPIHQYTKELISAMPRIETTMDISPTTVPTGDEQ
ncbi:dipeptide ABC transporter ATP-binding protein [Bifidobacterium aquikefiricola]|uniref:ABC transporter ATP-binding protein n=1 Tax=Bifidobacterium aquikefiricola TaxID=3059038 RepID=A0AB39U764_9BIFI